VKLTDIINSPITAVTHKNNAAIMTDNVHHVPEKNGTLSLSTETNDSV